MARVTRHRRVAQRRNASPGCSARPRLFIEFHLTRERIWRLLDRKAPIVDYEKASASAGIALSRMIFSAFVTDFHAAGRTHFSGRVLVALVTRIRERESSKRTAPLFVDGAVAPCRTTAPFPRLRVHARPR